MLNELSSWCLEVFDNQMFHERVSANLSACLQKLASPQFRDIKVANPERFRFEPFELLYMLVSISCNLSVRSFILPFLQALDGFCKEIVQNDMFKVSYLYMARRGIRKAKKQDVLPRLGPVLEKLSQLEKERTEESNEEELLEDPPEEFVCPISMGLMKDPVRLPTSGTVCDRASMKRQLLNSEIDPFSRQPLKFEELIPLEDLKARIEVWIR